MHRAILGLLDALSCEIGSGHADWTIALASTQMVRALFPSGSPKLRTLNAASWALMPFQPTAVSTANIGIAEVGLCLAPAERLCSVLLTAVPAGRLHMASAVAESWPMKPA